MLDKAPEFSVVIATYNRASSIDRSVRSVLDGTFQDLEVVVVDDGSTDNTASVLAEISDERLTVLHQPNQGRTAARNNGASVARGRLLAFLDSDDYVEPDWLAAMHFVFQSSQDYGVVCCGFRQTMRDEKGSVLKSTTTAPENLGPVYYDVIARFATGTYTFTSADVQEVGGYDRALAHAENTELAHRLLALVVKRGLRVGSTPRILLNYEQCRAETSRSDFEVRLLAAKTILERHGERYREHGGAKRSNYFAIAGTSSAYLGDLPAARRFFANAVRDAPTSLRQYARLLAACIPPVANRCWTLNDATSNDL